RASGETGLAADSTRALAVGLARLAGDLLRARAAGRCVLLAAVLLSLLRQRASVVLVKRADRTVVDAGLGGRRKTDSSPHCQNGSKNRLTHGKTPLMSHRSPELSQAEPGLVGPESGSLQVMRGCFAREDENPST